MAMGWKKDIDVAEIAMLMKPNRKSMKTREVTKQLRRKQLIKKTTTNVTNTLNQLRSKHLVNQLRSKQLVNQLQSEQLRQCWIRVKSELPVSEVASLHGELLANEIGKR